MKEMDKQDSDDFSDDFSEENDSPRRSESREMHKAVCTECGCECEVPFKPEKGKPVRCQECFRKSRPPRRFDGGNSRFGGGNRFNSNNRFDRFKKMHKATCDKCKKECEVPFKPSGDKPVYCKDCFMKKREESF